MARLTQAQARRAMLAAQGFADKRPRGAPDVRHFRRVMNRMGVLQLDSVNVVSRSHFLPVFARLGAYDRNKLDDWLWRSRENVEYWAHVASITPMVRQPLMRYRMTEGRWSNGGRNLEKEHPDYLAAVLELAATDGPITIGDLDDGRKRGGAWWGWSQGKVALDWLYITGRLAVDHRDTSFGVHYDLPERVIPPDVLAAPTPTRDEALVDLTRIAVGAVGVGTVADIADWFRVTQKETKAALVPLIASGDVIEVDVDGWGVPAFAPADLSIPRRIDACTLLSPFDPVVWFRPRAERVFDFHYRIEIYVPEPKRVYGYYVLPLLLGERLVGRFCVKADRHRSVLMARGSFVEDGADVVETADGAARALNELADFLGLDEVEVADNGNLARSLMSALAS